MVSADSNTLCQAGTDLIYKKKKTQKKNTLILPKKFNMFEFLIDNIFVMYGGRFFQQTVGIPMGKNCAPLLADLFLYSYEGNFMQGLLSKNEKKLGRSYNFTFSYTDDILSLKYSRFGDFVDRVYPFELEIMDTTYLDLHLAIDSEGRLRTKLYDKSYDLNFPIVNFPFTKYK